jgi:hypothetical protein
MSKQIGLDRIQQKLSGQRIQMRFNPSHPETSIPGTPTRSLVRTLQSNATGELDCPNAKSWTPFCIFLNA